MSISKAYLDRLHTRLLNLAEQVANKADYEAGETQEQEERANALREVSDALYEAMIHIEQYANI